MKLDWIVSFFTQNIRMDNHPVTSLTSVIRDVKSSIMFFQNFYDFTISYEFSWMKRFIRNVLIYGRHKYVLNNIIFLMLF